jgi:hypothetical protein
MISDYLSTGGVVPTKRSDADGVGVVATQREAQRDGGLVLSGAQRLGSRRTAPLAGPRRENEQRTGIAHLPQLYNSFS